MHRRPGVRRDRWRRVVLAVAPIAVLGALALAAGAQAGELADSAGGCSADPPLERPFLPWLDPADYTLLPGGSFEDGAAGWSLDGAGIVAGNESYRVHNAGDASSLAIPAGGSATSPTTCVGLEEPTLRLFVRGDAPSLLSTLEVEVLFENRLGVSSVPIGVVPAVSSTSWNPHLPMAIGADLLALVGDKTPVRFRFTALGSTGWRIDDVYVDPRRH